MGSLEPAHTQCFKRHSNEKEARVCDTHATIEALRTVVLREFGVVRFMQLDSAEEPKESDGNGTSEERRQGLDESWFSSSFRKPKDA